ncbi:hypothetical protein ACSAZL_10650 [Methanosarcina sp. T3]|uniref:hypothetical protein n=1 Tax=Methanosarcina sp. T3 TaxID=3439062 RepID=UPI003F866961
MRKKGGIQVVGIAMPIIGNMKEFPDFLALFEENMSYWKKHDLTEVTEVLKPVKIWNSQKKIHRKEK